MKSIAWFYKHGHGINTKYNETKILQTIKFKESDKSHKWHSVGSKPTWFNPMYVAELYFLPLM